ncbi:MAG: ATP-binding cassette domain-containing protein, partial [Acidobacteria bacterium]|nr:ATP-binding cassette domain-containing protein [Acidobacteriota bacterium]
MAKEKGKKKEAGVATAPEAQPAEAPTATFGPPPPIRRIVVEEEPTIVAPPPPGAVPPARANGSAPGQGINRLASAHPPTEVVERMRTSDLRLFYGDNEAVKGVSIPVCRGEVLALIGPSGCGKTTLLRSLNRLTELTPGARREGQIFLDGEDIDRIEVT